MTEVTPTYQFPYPDLTDTPNVPSDMQNLATAIEQTMQNVDARARIGRIVSGQIDFTGREGLWTVKLGFQPQLVEFVTQVTNPLASSNNPATYSRGILGVAADGTTYQYNTGVRIATTPTAERRTMLTRCAGLMVDDTTISNNAVGAFTVDGFSLNVSVGTGAADQSAFWVAHE